MEQKRPKSEAELIATVANIHDAEDCLRFAQRATKAGMLALATACIDRAKVLKPLKEPGIKTTTPGRSETIRVSMKTHVVAERALGKLIEDYQAGLPPTTYSELLQHFGFEARTNGRWFGQVTDLIDAACALAGVPSFALVRVREANGDVNHDAWRRNSHLRDSIIARALAGAWTAEDFTKIHASLADFSARAFGNKKAWDYVRRQINLDDWAGATKDQPARSRS
jgi:hypothetical protein